MKSQSRSVLSLIAATLLTSMLLMACSSSRPAVTLTFWKNLKVSQSSASQHRTIASSYRQSALEYRRMAQEHERMKAEYAVYDSDVATVMQSHCDSLVQKFNDLAAEMEAMANEHEEFARLADEPSKRPLLEF